MFSCPPHMQLGVVQQSKGCTALGRLAYQANTAFNDGSRREDYTRFRHQHLGGLVMLPEGAPAEFADECSFVMAVAFREKRVDAQAGRTLDFSLPRIIPEGLLLPMAAFVVAPFVKLGMAIRLDVECPAASDGGTNPHAHGFLSQRSLEDHGFGNKYRPWNKLFLRNLGRHVRALIAGQITLASALVGVGAYMDPRRNEAAGLPKAEERVPDQHWRQREREIPVASIEKLKAARQEKKAAMGKLPTAGMDTTEEPKWCIVANAVSRHRPMSIKERRRNLNFVIPFALDAGAETSQPSSGRDGITLLTGDGLTTFDGEKFASSGIVGPAQARLIVKLAQALDWPAMVVEGDTGSADEIIVAGVPIGITAINRCASPRAIRLIQENYGHLLADTIRPLDPLSVAVNAFEAAQANSGNFDIEIERAVSEKLEPASDFDEPCSPEIVASTDSLLDDHIDRLPVPQPRRGSLGNHPANDFDEHHSEEPASSDPKRPFPKTVFDCYEFDFPEPPKPTAAEEEIRRQHAADIWKNHVARNFEVVPLNPSRAARETRAPPKPFKT